VVDLAAGSLLAAAGSLLAAERSKEVTSRRRLVVDLAAGSLLAAAGSLLVAAGSLVGARVAGRSFVAWVDPVAWVAGSLLAAAGRLVEAVRIRQLWRDLEFVVVVVLAVHLLPSGRRSRGG